MKQLRTTALAICALGLSACMTPIGPVEVTRFHEPAAFDALGKGTIAVEAAPGSDPESLELSSYRMAVSRELQRLGYETVPEGQGTQVAEVRVRRISFQPPKNSPVSVGVGGSTGTYGAGVGVGVGLDLSGPPPEQVTTELGVMIKERAGDRTIWEGRARFTVRSDAPLAQTQLGAAKMAAAMFTNFPGNNGETVEIK